MVATPTIPDLMEPRPRGVIEAERKRRPLSEMSPEEIVALLPQPEPVVVDAAHHRREQALWRFVGTALAYADALDAHEEGQAVRLGVYARRLRETAAAYREVTS